MRSCKSWVAMVKGLVVCFMLSGLFSFACAQSTLPAADVEGDLLKKLAEARAAQKSQSEELPAAAAQNGQSATLPAALIGQMISIPGGTFQMGDLAGDGQPNERPVHAVTIKPFKLGKYEVTVGQFRAFVAATAYKTELERENTGCFGIMAGGKYDFMPNTLWSSPGFPQTDSHPVVCVTWNDVQSFIQWLNTKTGQRFRLPTEAEWEYAARAGSSGRYPWGNDADQGCSYANGQDLTPGFATWPSKMNCSDGYFFTAPVGKYLPNAFGLYDMTGNAWEWTSDCWNDTQAGAPADGSARLAGECGSRIDRGGSWVTSPSAMRVSVRHKDVATFRTNGLGFRLAQDL